MAFDQATRNRLQRFVNDARKVLETEFGRQLQNEYGLDPNSGAVAPLDKLDHLPDAKKETARILRDILAHYLANEAGADSKAALERIVREQAFTVLNRIVALRMAEARGLLIESIDHGYQAKGFQLYARVLGNSLGETGDAYRCYLFSVFDELAQDLPGLFDRYSPQGRLFPRENALLQLIELVNQAEISPLWAEDEAIGWIFQYFNSKEERKKMRDESAAPRNSRELAVRNQFFTPRYVVEFLVDNTLGRLWFQATGGETALRESCRYLLVKPDEKPAPGSRMRDPRTLKLLDPACGSMHFGLYAFDLFSEIYREAWAWEQQNGPGSLDGALAGQELLPLCQSYVDEAAFLRDIPRLIIERNIYGVDIDPRAAQIAALALWLRAQRAWHEAAIKATDRPAIGRGNVVAAIAPPHEPELREQMKAMLDGKDATLFEKTLQLLKNLPELGVLLRVEQELPALIRQVYGETGGLFKESDAEKWQKAELRLREALVEYAQAAKSTYQSRLFAQDAMELLRMIDLIREKFDVVVMNPPFGEITERTTQYIDLEFLHHTNNQICVFVERAMKFLRKGGFCGSVVDRTVLIKNSYEKFRTELLLTTEALDIVTDCGWGVLDANVEVSAIVFSQKPQGDGSAIGLDISQDIEKAAALLAQLNSFVEMSHSAILAQPFAAINFQMPEYLRRAIKNSTRLIDSGFGFFNGHTIKSDVFKRLCWEVLPQFLDEHAFRMWNGSEYSPYYVPFQECVLFKDYAGGLQNHSSTILRNTSKHFQAGLCFGKRGEYLDVQILPEGFVLTNEGFGGPAQRSDLTWYVLGIINSLVVQTSINFYCGQHKGVGYVNILPLVGVNSREYSKISTLTQETFRTMQTISKVLETDPGFICPPISNRKEEWIDKYKSIGEKIKNNVSDIDELAFDVFGVTPDERQYIVKASKNRPQVFPILGLNYNSEEAITLFWGHAIISYALGCIFGRWDIRHAMEKTRRELLTDPFIKLPVYQPGMLQNVKGIPTLINYPIKISEHGVWVEDASDNGDVIEALRAVLHVIWGNNANRIEEEICSIFKLSNLRDYMRNPNEFFAKHLQQYSKSRRQAPIYWPLSTASGSYTLWLYYPSLTNQTLYTCVNDFLEPKLKQVGGELANLRGKGSKRSLSDENQFEKLQTFELELTELRDTLLKIAPHYHPNQDDGVQITAAPLWPLFRHKPWQKVLKETWAKLEKGDYDWAHLAMQYWPERVRAKCKADKSLAIAHGLEELYVEPVATTKKKTKK